MAIFHLSAKVVSRAKGQSIVAAAAYRSGESLTDEKTGELKVYRNRKERIIYKAIYAPPHAPIWMHDRNSLWNAVNQVERRRNSTLAREVECALPSELTHEQQVMLLADFVRENFTRHNLVADVAMHLPDKDADFRNDHVHILFPERRVEADGFAAKKDRSLQDTATLLEWRRRWANLCNRYLERFGHADRIDHRSLADQGVDRQPTMHLGHAATAIERRGGVSRRRLRMQAVKNEGVTSDVSRREDLAGGAPGASRGPGVMGAVEPGLGGGPGRCADRRSDRAYERSERPNRGDQRAASRDRPTFKPATGLRLNFALRRHLSAIIAARKAAADLSGDQYRLHRASVPGRDVDQWGVGQLPTPRS